MSSFWLILKQQWTIKNSSPRFSIFSLVAILDRSRDHRTQFWKGAIQGPFHQCLVAIGPVVSEEKIKIRNVDGRKAMAIAHMAWRVKKGCTRLASASDKVYQLLAHGWWFSLGTPASSTTKTDRHDTTEILLSGVKHQKSINQSIFYSQ